MLRTRWKAKLARSNSSTAFDRDAIPHRGLLPRIDFSKPRAVTYRPPKPNYVPKTKSPRNTNTGGTPVRRSLTIDEFYHPPDSVSLPSNPNPQDHQQHLQFSSPPLLPGLHKSLIDSLGHFALPTPIQSLSLKSILPLLQDQEQQEQHTWHEFFLASETGSGKSIAYLLPLLQSLKQAELADNNTKPPLNSTRPYNPRGLIFAPTHELARQLSRFAKSLSHEIKLRVLCASQANTKNAKTTHVTSSRKMAATTLMDDDDNMGFGGSLNRVNHPVDILVGTPMKLLEMIRGRGWDRRETDMEDEDLNEEGLSAESENKHRRGRDFTPGFGTTKSVQLGLKNVEWVVIDEADVLLDPDFQATTRLLLSDISTARGHPIPLNPSPELESISYKSNASSSPPNTTSAVSYPFNLILTSATIPNSLNNYLQNHHPSLVRLSSPDLHHLPKTLKVEYAPWSGGNKFADIHRRIREVWSNDAAAASNNAGGGEGSLSKVLIFCNKSTKAIELSEFLEKQGVKCIPMTSASEYRKMGSNRHLEDFLKKKSIVELVSNKKTLNELRRVHGYHRAGTFVSGTPTTTTTTTTTTTATATATATTTEAAEKARPLVMVTTSLLSRGLDFSPEVKHVFIVDEPRNMVDFLHRAGRAGRAGHRGKVVVFGKVTGRNSARTKEVRKRVGGLMVVGQRKKNLKV